ncbi:hypothetical protein [Embleya scabrispora]|uniref:hypothetical protein n=1 Tax=Embleya scabrispora TaxID=159449 RepID=UPI0003A3C34D|nr:hypothetical protein [Embleya scabrispora]MYS79446.1 hypothetical protein [Streptomyces sp. SID5474]
MRKQNFPSGPGASGPGRDDAPIVERDERDRAARQARVTDGPGPSVDNPPEPPARAMPHQQHDQAEPYGTTVHPTPRTGRDAPPAPTSPPAGADPRGTSGTGPVRDRTRTDDSTGRSNGTHDNDDAAMFDRAAAEELNHRFREALAGFVDSPSDSVSEADDIAAQVTKLVTDSIQTRRTELEQTKRTAGGDTEQLRLALHKYRTFLQSMLKL